MVAAVMFGLILLWEGTNTSFRRFDISDRSFRVLSVPRTKMPGFIKPQLATLKMKAPAGDQWIHEIKYDGYRVQIHLDRGKVRVFTRNGHDWTKRFSRIAHAFDLRSSSI